MGKGVSRIYGSKKGQREVYSGAEGVQQPKGSTPLLRWTGRRYEVRNSFEIRTTLKQAGFQWDGSWKCWWTEDAKIARQFIRYADKATGDKLMADDIEEESL